MNKKKCAVQEITDKDDFTKKSLPETTTINLEDEDNQQALAFYSRYHVKYVKLPEMKDSVKNIETVMTNCNCDSQVDIVMCPFGDGEEASCAALRDQVAFLNNAITEWNEYLLPKEDFRNNSIVNWFEEVGSKLMKDE